MHLQYKKAIDLCLKGLSYNEIAHTLNVSKGSLSVWFKHLKLPKKAQKLLEGKMRIAREHNLFENNRRRTRAIQIENQQIRQSAANDIRPLSGYELLLIGAALYWAEGYNRILRERDMKFALPILIRIWLNYFCGFYGKLSMFPKIN